MDLPLDVSNGSALWLAVPILAATLHLSRGYVAFKCASHALGALRATVPIGEAETALRFKAVNGLPPTIPFEFDDAWPIWPGPIANNLPSLALVNRTDLDALLRATRLLPELGGSVDAVLAKHITLDGTNLSSGQHCRLQIVRGVLFAQANNQTMRVPPALPALDRAAMISTREVLARHRSVSFAGVSCPKLVRMGGLNLQSTRGQIKARQGRQ